MALVAYGPGITDARGSVAGTVFSRNRYGGYMRGRTTPVNPQSSRQEAARNIVSQLAARWTSTVTAAQRLAWETYAAAIAWQNKLGQSVNLTGFSMYIRSNSAMLAAAGLIVDDGPTTLALPDTDPSFAVTASEATGDLTITFDDTMVWCDEDNSFMSVAMHQPKGVGVNYFGGPFRIAGAIAGDSVTPPTSTETLTAPYTLTETQLTVCEARIILADGRVTNRFRSAPFAVAA